MTIGIVSDNSCRLILDTATHPNLQTTECLKSPLPTSRVARTSNTNNSGSPETKVSRQQTPCRNQSSRNTKASDTICSSNFQNIRVTKHQMSKFKYTDRTQRDYLTPKKPSQRSRPPLTKQSLKHTINISPEPRQRARYTFCQLYYSLRTCQIWNLQISF